MYTLILALALSGPGVPAAAAPAISAPTLSGRVTTPDGAAIGEVRVTLLEANRITRTDADGRYEFPTLARGTYGVAFARIGYAPQVFRVRLADSAVTLAVVLQPSLIELPELQVTSSPLATTALNAPQPTSVLSGGDLRTSGAPSLGETASVLPGVRSVSTGSGIGKPVIRGLTSNRVLVLADGQRLETQQWGDEHSPNVETADAERIEVIRGPASVLYGSDALGGVINVVDRELPDAIGKAPFLRARASAGYATNNEQPEGTLAVEGASGAIGFRLSGAGRSSGDLTTPDGPLFNSALRSVNGSGSLGVRGGWGSTHVTYSKRDERLEVHEDPAEDAEATPFQRIGEDRVHVELSLPAGESHFDVDAGYERNRRREFAEEGASDVELGLLSKTWTADVRFHHVPIGRFDGIVGVTGLRNTFEKFGEETLIPGSGANNVGVFASEQATFGPVVLSLGARYDYRKLDVDADEVLGIEAQTRTYSAVSGSAGIVLRTSGTTAVVVNVGRGFRAPSTFELFSDGVHEGTARFERGSPTLANETSLNTDLAFRVQSNRLSAEVGGFVNYIDNFIYPRPTGAVDPESGFRIFDYTQGNARLYGLESAVEYHPTAWLHFRGGADYVRGQNTDLGIPLVFIPPVRVTYSLQLEGQPFGAFSSPYLSVAGETNAHQSKLDPDDVAPPGYTLAHLGAGIGLGVGERTFSLDVQVRNFFDKRYTAFLSRYKTYALDPGRNVIVRLSTGF